ncbi:hypothetical protein NP7_03205 [Moraxella osloensis]|uniref:Uncharacterized protein n=1 Tax=Faucicola osloensis TaxID=34062 RepID=A0A2D2LTL1_FAUOS|nr:hypothetical protein NP7_03205 [Moraxella osloensis]
MIKSCGYFSKDYFKKLRLFGGYHLVAIIWWLSFGGYYLLTGTIDSDYLLPVKINLPQALQHL